MRHVVKGALLMFALAGSPMVAATSLANHVDFSITLGNSAYGYQDGYWDRDHHWHHWRNRAEARYFQEHYRDHYVDSRHNHDPHDRNKGWREDHWWDHH